MERMKKIKLSLGLVALLVLGIGVAAYAAQSLLINCWYSSTAGFFCSGQGHHIQLGIGPTTPGTGPSFVGGLSGLITGDTTTFGPPFPTPFPSPVATQQCGPRSLMVTAHRADGTNDTTYICCAYNDTTRPVWKLGASCP